MTVAILKQIRDEIRATREDLSKRIDQNTERLGSIEGALLDLAEQQRFVVRWLRAGGQRDRQLAHELDLVKLRLDLLEGHSEG